MRCPACKSTGAYVGLEVVECPSPLCEFYDEDTQRKGYDYRDATVNGDPFDDVLIQTKPHRYQAAVRQ